MEKIIPEKMTRDNLDDIVDLHLKILSWSVNGQLGRDHIHELYSNLFNNPHFFGYVYYYKNDLIGFSTATTDYGETRKSIMQVFRKKVLSILTKNVFHPKLMIGFFESRFIVPRVYNKLNVKAEWLTFVTDITKTFLSPFVAAKLIEETDKHFKKLGMNYIAQGVKKNPKAINYYKKLNWKMVKALFVHNIYLFEIEKQKDIS